MTDADTNEPRVRRQAALALQVLSATLAAVATGQPADAFLARYFKQHHAFGARDRRRLAHAVFSFFRWRGWILRLAPEDLAGQLAWALALENELVGDPMVDAAVASLDLPDPVFLRGRNLDETLARLNELRPDAGVAREQLVPEWVAGALPADADFDTFIAACQTRPPTWVWVEPARVRDFAAMLTAQQIAHTVDPRMPGAVALRTPFQLQLLERAWGWSIQVQDIGSQAVAAVCGARPGESWWDACSGAGGKSLALARQVGPDGAVLATDVRESILANLRQRAVAFRCANISAVQLDAARSAPPGRIFDGVLVDAPCSGLGTWPRNPDARWRTSPDDLRTRAAIQQQILGNVAPRIKPGGVLIYALCTVTAAESRDVVAAFLDTHPVFQLERFTDPLTGRTVEGERIIQPGEGPGDGMYVARLRRIA